MTSGLSRFTTSVLYKRKSMQQIRRTRGKVSFHCYGYKTASDAIRVGGIRFLTNLKGQSNKICDLQFFFIIQTSLGH